jgi:hypothetical protein
MRESLLDSWEAGIDVGSEITYLVDTVLLLALFRKTSYAEQSKQVIYLDMQLLEVAEAVKADCHQSLFRRIRDRVAAD